MAREEIFEIFGDSDRPCTAEDAAQMKYLECCIKEALRLYPSVPFISRQMCEDSELDGYKIPSGVSVAVQIYALHRNEEYFPEPEVFKPERFQTEESLGRHPFAFVPFSAGPRNCIGTSLRRIESVPKIAYTMQSMIVMFCILILKYFFIAQVNDSPCWKRKYWRRLLCVNSNSLTTRSNMDSPMPMPN